MDKSKSYRVAGGILRNGVLVRDAHQNIARAGADKKLTSPAPAYGAVSPKAGPLAFVGGKRPLDDEPNDKLTGKSSPIHNGMGSETPEHRGADYGLDHGSSILQRAGSRSLDKHGDVSPGQLPPAPKRR